MRQKPEPQPPRRRRFILTSPNLQHHQPTDSMPCRCCKPGEVKVAIRLAQDTRAEEARASFCERAVVVMRLKAASKEAADQSPLSRVRRAAAQAVEALTATC